MTDTTAAWTEVGHRFTELGHKLKSHFDAARTDDTEPAAEAATGTPGPDAGKEATDAVQAALRKLGAAIDDVVDAVGAAVKDPAVKGDVREVGGALSSAISTSFTSVSEELRKTFGKGDTHDQAPPTEPPPPSA